MRPTALLLAALLLAAASPRGAAPGARTPHDFEKVGCTHCHLAVPGQGRALQRTVFRKSIDDLCQDLPRRVPRGQPQPPRRDPPLDEGAADDLHLNDRGELSCVTCHDPHGEYISSTTGARTWFLRRQMLKRELCLACHADESLRGAARRRHPARPREQRGGRRAARPAHRHALRGGVAEVTVEINDARLVLSVENGAFSTMLKLREGINTVRIGGAGVVPEVLNILFSPALPREMTYRLYRSHGMVNRKDCFVCHDREARSFAIAGRDAALCGKCHDPRPAARFLHGPVAVGSCTRLPRPARPDQPLRSSSRPARRSASAATPRPTCSSTSSPAPGASRGSCARRGAPPATTRTRRTASTSSATSPSDPAAFALGLDQFGRDPASGVR